MLFVSLLIKKIKSLGKNMTELEVKWKEKLVFHINIYYQQMQTGLIALSVITQLIELRIWYLAKQFVNCQMNYFES